MTSPTDLLFPSNYTDKDTAVARAKVCNTCDRLFRATFSCKECGCFMKAKVKLSNAECPLGKWASVEKIVAEPKAQTSSKRRK